MKNLIAKVEVSIHAPVGKVWEALTQPEIIQQYFFGTQVVTDWKEGSSIIWKGVWQGKAYEDKGTILQNVPQQLLVMSYWSSMSGTPDSKEHYKIVRYELIDDENGNTKFILTQDNNLTEDAKIHSEQNWKLVLEGLKKLVEQ